MRVVLSHVRSKVAPPRLPAEEPDDFAPSRAQRHALARGRRSWRVRSTPKFGRWRAFAASPLASMIELAKTEAEDDLRTQTFALQRFSEFREMRLEDRRYSSAPISQLGAG